MNKTDRSTIHPENEPPDRGVPPRPSMDPRDRAVAQGGAYQDRETPASQGGAYPLHDPLPASQARRRAR